MKAHWRVCEIFWNFNFRKSFSLFAKSLRKHRSAFANKEKEFLKLAQWRVCEIFSNSNLRILKLKIGILKLKLRIPIFNFRIPIFNFRICFRRMMKQKCCQCNECCQLCTSAEADTKQVLQEQSIIRPSFQISLLAPAMYINNLTFSK